MYSYSSCVISDNVLYNFTLLDFFTHQYIQESIPNQYIEIVIILLYSCIIFNVLFFESSIHGYLIILVFVIIHIATINNSFIFYQCFFDFENRDLWHNRYMLNIDKFSSIKILVFCTEFVSFRKCPSWFWHSGQVKNHWLKLLLVVFYSHCGFILVLLLLLLELNV